MNQNFKETLIKLFTIKGLKIYFIPFFVYNHIHISIADKCLLTAEDTKKRFRLNIKILTRCLKKNKI
jgi:hypothetical protein